MAGMIDSVVFCKRLLDLPDTEYIELMADGSRQKKAVGTRVIQYVEAIDGVIVRQWTKTFRGEYYGNGNPEVIGYRLENCDLIGLVKVVSRAERSQLQAESDAMHHQDQVHLTWATRTGREPY